MMCPGADSRPSQLALNIVRWFDDTTQPFVKLRGEFRLAVQSSDMISASLASSLR